MINSSETRTTVRGCSSEFNTHHFFRQRNVSSFIFLSILKLLFDGSSGGHSKAELGWKRILIFLGFSEFVSKKQKDDVEEGDKVGWCWHGGGEQQIGYEARKQEQKIVLNKESGLLILIYWRKLNPSIEENAIVCKR